MAERKEKRMADMASGSGLAGALQHINPDERAEALESQHKRTRITAASAASSAANRAMQLGREQFFALVDAPPVVAMPLVRGLHQTLRRPPKERERPRAWGCCCWL